MLLVSVVIGVIAVLLLFAVDLFRGGQRVVRYYRYGAAAPSRRRRLFGQRVECREKRRLRDHLGWRVRLLAGLLVFTLAANFWVNS